VAQKKLPWSIVLLLGGGFALAKGSEVRDKGQYVHANVGSPSCRRTFLTCRTFQTLRLKKASEVCTKNVATPSKMTMNYNPHNNSFPLAVGLFLCCSKLAQMKILDLYGVILVCFPQKHFNQKSQIPTEN
jgi:hypothetical protein